MYFLEREMPSNYQNGNTLKAFALNAYRWEQLAICEDKKALVEYAEGNRDWGDLRIINNLGEETIHIKRRVK